MKMKLIDKYIITQFIRNFLFALLCFIIIFILVDLFENLDKFIDNKLGLLVVFNYYLLFSPDIIRLITPIAVLLATLFTAGRMVTFNEIIGIKNAGVSMIRFMVPFLAIGAVITGISLYFNNWIVPQANKDKYSLESKYLGRYQPTIGFNRLYFQDSRNQIIIIEQYNEYNLTAKKVSILVYNPDNLIELKKRIDAEKMKWSNNEWVLENAVERDFSDRIEAIHTYKEIPAGNLLGISKINITPAQISKKQLKPDEMSYGELRDYIDNQAKGSQNVDKLRVDFYSKISFPFSSLIVIIFGISISTGSKKRKSLAMQFAISILVSFIYLGFVKISQTFGYNGDLDPLLTAWLANIAFAAFGTINLYLKNY
jgi:lipopolysaccharide export system permease protein